MRRCAGVELLASVLIVATAAMAQEQPDSDRRCRALAALADRGELGIEAVVAALDDRDEALGRTAAAIVRHEWQELPQELFLLLDGRQRGTRRLLEEFARAPRPAARAWVLRQTEARSKRSLDHRLLALAALGQPLRAAEANLLLEALRQQQDGDGFHLVLPLVSDKVADGLIGRVHQGLLQQQFAVDRLTYLLDRLSPRGTRSLLGLAVTLPVDVARVLCRHVHQTRPELVLERVAAVLDGTAPIEEPWLTFAGKVLDRPARIERVLSILRDDESADRRELAFEALLEAKVVDEPVLAAAIDEWDDGRIRRVLMKAAEHVPPPRLVAWLRDGSAEVSAATAQALARFPGFGPEVQRALLAMLRDADAVDGGAAFDALTAIVQSGDAAALAEVWPKLMASRGWSLLLDRLGHRDEPYVYELLLGELARGQATIDDGVTPDRVGDADAPRERRRQQLDMVRLLLVGRGDRRELETLVRHAPAASPTFLRRCRHYAGQLPGEYVEPLVAAAKAADDPQVASELLEWVATNEDRAPGRLLRLWREAGDRPAQEELREIALRVTAMGPGRSGLVESYREAVRAGVLPDRMSSLPYELLNSMREPMSVDDVRLAAQILLWPPLGDPDEEARLVRRWPDGSFGFPQVAAIAARLRRADPTTATLAFSEVVDDLRDDPHQGRISRQRLKVFWRSLAMAPELMHAVGTVTAQLWSFGEGEGAGDGEARAVVADGPALWLAALAAENDRDHERAERLYRRAIGALLRLPATRQEARWLLGDRDPAGGDDPWARLSAAPHRMRYLAARLAGDEAAAAAAAELVREFAGHDEPALATLNPPTPESGR